MSERCNDFGDRRRPALERPRHGALSTCARIALVAATLAVASCNERIPPSARDSWGPCENVVSHPVVRFAVIGDYGLAGPRARAVARVAIGWRPDLIVTTGDNNYPQGAAATIDGNVGRYYHRFLAPYLGGFGRGAIRNRFFPSLGNHDLNTAAGRAYFDYFTLPGNERYYDFTAGPVRFFALNSDKREPDGVRAWSAQRSWLRRRLAESDAAWNVVYFHHPPYSSGEKLDHGSWMQWPFAAWGADVVLSGHEHFYERLVVDGVTYFVVGLGGAQAYDMRTDPSPASRARFNGDHGALLVGASAEEFSFRFTTRTGVIVDQGTLVTGTRVARRAGR